MSFLQCASKWRPAKKKRAGRWVRKFAPAMRRRAASSVQKIREGQVMIITELTEQIEDSRRYTRVLFEDAIGRIALVSEGLAALSGRVDGVETRLSIQIERTDAKLDMVLARLDRLARDQH